MPSPAEFARPEDHDVRTQAIAARVRELVATGQPVRISKGGVSHFVPLPNDARLRGAPIDISGLNRILEIDPANQVCTAEPGLTFAVLLAETLKHGLMPAVVPELEGITLGGAVAGCSVESMSYRYGGFHDTCLEYEVVTGDGRVLVLTPEKTPLEFAMVHGSYGTLAVLTRLRFRLIPALPYVKMEYRRFHESAAFETELRARCQKADFDFVDAIVHSPHDFVVCLGRFVAQAPYLSNYRWLNIFYKSTLARAEDYLTTADYCFRYDTECHWLTKTIPLMETLPARLLLGKLVLGSTRLIRWSKRLDRVLALKKRPDVVCDIFIPASRFQDFYRWYERDFRFFPLWVIPYRPPRVYEWVDDFYARGLQGELLFDCAVYGKPNSGREVDYSELLERKTYELGGLKTLISSNFHSRGEFWSHYHRANYDRAKHALDPAGVFTPLYEKMHPGAKN